MEWSFFRNFAITLFALLNPLGMLPIFISYTARERQEVQRLVALFVSLTVLCLLLIFMFIGTSMLKFFGVTLDSFRLAGGVLLLMIGINIVNGSGGGTKELLINERGGDYRLFVTLYAKSTDKMPRQDPASKILYEINISYTELSVKTPLIYNTVLFRSKCVIIVINFINLK